MNNISINMSYNHLALYKMVKSNGFSGFGLSIPSFKAKTYRFTSSLTLAYDAKTQLV
jgi:hypothetical protein